MMIKEFIQVFRDPRMRVMIFVSPAIQLLVYGYAVTIDVKHVTTAIYDLDNSVESRDLWDRFIKTRYFDVVEWIDDPRRVASLLDRGEVQFVLHVNHGFANDLLAGRSAQVQVHLDGTDSNTAGIVLNYVAAITGRFSDEYAARHALRLKGRIDRVAVVRMESRAWFNDNLESVNFFVPGTIALIVTLTALLLTSMAIVREKEIGTMEQIMVTPITPAELILGKTLPFALIALLDVTVITLVGVVIFDVPLRGNVLLLIFAAGLYFLTPLGVGLIISTLSRTQQQAMMSTFFFFMPATLLSGFVFPINNMPEAVQVITYLDPLRYFLVIIRGIFLKGIGLDVLWTQFAALAVMGAVSLTIASKRFRKTLA